jgi:hypothetical protein
VTCFGLRVLTLFIFSHNNYRMDINTSTGCTTIILSFCWLAAITLTISMVHIVSFSRRRGSLGITLKYVYTVRIFLSILIYRTLVVGCDR